MSKAAMAGLIGLAVMILGGGLTLGLRSGYSQFASVSFGLLPALLVIYPIVRERSAGEVSFLQWLGILFLALLFAIVANNIGAAMTTTLNT